MKKFAAVVGALLVVGLTGSASAARPWQDIHFDATVNAADSSVLSNDGNAHYSGSEVLARVIDYAATGTDNDSFIFAPQHKRKITFQHPDAADGQHLLCSSGGYLFFRSYSSGSSTWEEIQSQGSAVGAALIRCLPENGNSSHHVVRFPGTSADGGAGECVSFVKAGETTYTVGAAAYVAGGAGVGIGPLAPASGCPATISEVRWEKGSWEELSRVENASAPFTLELTLQQ